MDDVCGDYDQKLFWLEDPGDNKTNDPIFNLTPENITQHSGIE